MNELVILLLPEFYSMVLSSATLIMRGATLGGGWEFPKESYYDYILVGLLIGSTISLFMSLHKLGV